jgi:outer membrane protein assembly factor BamA
MFDLALLQREVYPRKMKDLLKLKQQLEQNSGLVQAKVSSVSVVTQDIQHSVKLSHK